MEKFFLIFAKLFNFAMLVFWGALVGYALYLALMANW